MAEKTRFDKAFDDHLLLRDVVLVVFLILGFGVPMGYFLEFGVFQAIASGIAFAGPYLAVMELIARRNGDSMFRYLLGGDSLAVE
ncbi:hypothetical protein Hrd1104_05630 [Halorhabdus sp. CBA1104]|uniref:hypothetical protein n=1 Tax=Halorhabdus sp. CBA1104 TaxID=1380432 RepID=UPI0012B37142|nr:hypothetical protein [Halorhabdus sp. CBA1104]QGN06823.1 hypothetical protein Hrd1104_05630 [Halorhabdus sp. CBA1104]